MSLKDTDKMPFGVHKGKAMVNVPASYLVFIYENGYTMPAEVRAYIEENMDALKLEKQKKK